MAQATLDTTGTSQPKKKCEDVKAILDKVIADLNEFEAKKLTELKTELDAFVKKKDTVVADYRKKYATLLQRWCDQHQLIENLHSSIQCSFPGQKWTDIVTRCICRKYKDRDCLEQRIERRRHCCSGVLESERDGAQRSFDWARKYLDVLTANAQKIEAELTDDDALIKKIQAAVPGPEQAVALYWFWFKLLPSHRRLAPAKLPDGCKNFDDQNDATLCAATQQEKCGPYTEGCSPPNDWKAPDRKPDPGPALIDPDAYEDALNCAWRDLRAAKDDLGSKEAAYKGAPDDLDSLEKQLKDLTTGLEASIIDCLKKEKPVDKCCPPAAPAPVDTTKTAGVATTPGKPETTTPAKPEATAAPAAQSQGATAPAATSTPSGAA